MILLVCGSRRYFDSVKIHNLLDEWLLRNGKPDLIIHGDCQGIDKISSSYFSRKGVSVRAFPAEWRLYGKAAGPIRNSQMIEICTHILAFPDADSMGTWDTVGKGRKVGRIIEVIEI